MKQSTNKLPNDSLNQQSKESNESTSKENKTISRILESKKTDHETGQTQYPKKVGYHGSDDEKNLNPEE